ncbi:hypothetical protein ACFY2V_34900 [Streptomyces eurythermus]|uniref:hypothetical protein n=1 Tax=Streptomyces eurythermus TaxID=42237 RepID=UPI00367A3A9F
MRKIALHGKPGAGKSTLADMLAQECARAGAPVRKLKLGAPLYDVQALVYTLAGRPLVDNTVQDGPLLNALGSAMRRINPDALIEPFAARVQQAEQLCPQVVLICDDMRAPDAEAVISLGFRLVKVTAPDELRLQRKERRGDLAAGDDEHSTEATVAAPEWRRVENTGSLDDLRVQAADLVSEVLR